MLDTETTGLSPTDGHRIVEIGCVELLNHVPTGRDYHRYVNPERSMPSEAFAVHGLSTDFLADKPTFAEIASEFCEFLADSPLVIHNAAFDLGFINAEFVRLEMPALSAERATDTVKMARQRFPGAPANLDALCRRFQIDISDRALHGALKDAQLLASVYLELLGGREPGLSLVSSTTRRLTGMETSEWIARLVFPNEDEEAAHQAFVGRIPDALWREARAASPATTARPRQGKKNSIV